MKNRNLIKCREIRGMTQEEVANELGICKDYVYMIENKKRTPSFALAKRIADLFDGTVDEIFFK